MLHSQIVCSRLSQEVQTVGISVIHMLSMVERLACLSSAPPLQSHSGSHSQGWASARRHPLPAPLSMVCLEYRNDSLAGRLACCRDVEIAPCRLLALWPPLHLPAPARMPRSAGGIPSLGVCQERLLHS